MVQRLLCYESARATIESMGHLGTALFYACDRGHATVVKLLLQAGADPTRSTNGGDHNTTPMGIAKAHEHRKCIRHLEVSSSRIEPLSQSDNLGKGEERTLDLSLIALLVAYDAWNDDDE